MCTINSLEGFWQRMKLPSSLWSVLLMIGIFAQQGRSGASNASMLAIQVSAPTDITINIRSVSRCDTTFLLPPATFSGNCSNVLTFSTSTIFNSFASNGGGPFYFPPGIHKVYFQVSDNCRMSGIDSMTVTVFDGELPQVVCAPSQTINLPDNGYAEAPAYIFDGGSSDNCGHVYFKVRRMFPSLSPDCQIPGTTLVNYDDQVSFCCADVDSGEILILLRVYDIFPGVGPVSDTLLRGHYVDCMVRALVRDKIQPELICPSDYTISCVHDLDSLLDKQILGSFDNCGILNIDTLDEDNLDACGSGTFIRTYVATDVHRLETQCRQTITVVRAHTFNGLDTNQLKWPDHKVVYACRIQVDTIQSGAPRIYDDACALVVHSYRDEVYQFNHGGVCAKLLRYWEVIDWCKYNPLLKPNPKISANGYYSYVQEIKVFDTIKPEINWLSDTIVGINTPDCSEGYVSLPSATAFDCGSNAHIGFRFEVDLFSNGTVDARGVGNNPSGKYPVGHHVITMFAKDSCHNEGSKVLELTVRDAKIPQAIAMYGVSSSLIAMPNGPMVSVNARLFNNKSSDNCTAAHNLRFSFSNDVNDTTRIYTCDSLGRRDIRLVVWDEAGNSGEVFTYFVVDDISGLCPTTIQNVQVEGAIVTSNDQPVPQADVKLSFNQLEKQIWTNTQGGFIFHDVPGNSVIQLRANHSSDFANGLSTADIIQIQRHILGIETISDPVRRIAADLDMNGGISTKDVVYLRNLILGKQSSLPHFKSYVFIDPAYKFADPENPYIELTNCQNIELRIDSSNQKVNFRAIKLGDVNFSYTSSGLTSYSSVKTIFYQLGERSISFYASESDMLSGFQLGLQFDGLCPNSILDIESNLNGWTKDHFRLDGDKIFIAYSNPSAKFQDVPTPLFTVLFATEMNQCQPIVGLLENFSSEWYQLGESMNVQLHKQYPSKSSNFKTSIVPNPIQNLSLLKIFSTDRTQVNIEVYNIERKEVEFMVKSLETGENSIELNALSWPGPGVYFLKITNHIQTEVLRIVKL